MKKITAIDMFYRKIILNNGIPFALKSPKQLPIRESMDDESFNVLMANRYLKAIQGESYDIDDFFKELEKEK